MSPAEVVRLYNFELWSERKVEWADRLIADQVTRHYIGRSEVLTKEESVERIKRGWKHIPELQFTLHHIIPNGNMVAIVWEANGKEKDGKDIVMSGIEVFKVIDGKICEVWNTEYTFDRWH